MSSSAIGIAPAKIYRTNCWNLFRPLPSFF